MANQAFINNTVAEIIKAYRFLREKNMDVPSEVIELMKDAAIARVKGTGRFLIFTYSEWAGAYGGWQDYSKSVDTIEDAKMIIKSEIEMGNATEGEVVDTFILDVVYRHQEGKEEYHETGFEIYQAKKKMR